jgi:NAD(P)-dependent dehydrogenase (short-subunit alcohol dehydrogenase family)
MLKLCAAQELGPRMIRVNSVHPGVTMTPLMRQGLEDYVEQGLRETTEAAEAERRP